MICLALPATAVVVAGCGTSGDVTKADALAYAHAINLRASDLPGWRPTIHERVQNARNREASLARCLGLPLRAERMTVVSSVFSRPPRFGETVSSRIIVPLGPLPSPQNRGGTAARGVAALTSARGRACMVGYAHELVAGRRPVSITLLPNPLTGNNGVVAYRFRARGTITKVFTRTSGNGRYSEEIGPGPSQLPPHSQVRRVPLSLYADVLVLNPPSAGATVELYAGGGAVPFPLQTEQRILSLLYSRAEAHRL